MTWIKINSTLINLDRIDMITQEGKSVIFWRSNDILNEFVYSNEDVSKEVVDLIRFVKPCVDFTEDEPPKEEAH